MTTNGNNNMELHLRISDTDLCEELKKHEEGEERDAFAIQAMRIGIIAIRHAQGQIDVDKIQREGDRIIENTKSVLTKYFNPNDGQFHQRIQQLIEENGELEQIIRKQIDGDKSPLGKTMTERNQTILDNFRKQFDLDEENGALNKMLKQLKEKIAEIHKKIDEEKGRKKESQRSPQKGRDFEKSVGEFLSRDWAGKGNHLIDSTGYEKSSTGKMKGDFVIELEPEHAAAGCKIVVEAKANKDYTLARAFKELEVARKNRGAEAGLFVFDKNHSPKGLDCFTRRGNDIVIVWDAEDYNNDVIFEAGLSVAVALCVQSENRKKADGVDVKSMKNIVKEIEESLDNLNTIEGSAQAIKIGNNEILKKVDEMKSKLPEKLSRLNDQINKLR